MKRFTSVLTISALVLILCTRLSQAEERVAFETPPVPPSAFKVKRAKAQGKIAQPTPGVSLSGSLWKPEGAGPHPAVVILPGGDGQQASNKAWARYLANNGYVVLFVESFAARGTPGFAASPALNLVIDAQSGRRYLNGLEYVDKENVGLLGFGQSGWFVQRILDAALADRPEDAAFKAGVALYPLCDPETRIVAPILILAGQQDKRVPLSACREMAHSNGVHGMEVELHVYPEASHAFDNPNYARDPAVRGEDWTRPIYYDQGRYDADIHANARLRVLKFFDSYLR